jgi:hypothetical protein
MLKARGASAVRPFLATKVWTSGAKEGVAQMRRSADRFGVKTIDLMQVHNLMDWKTHLPRMRAWKQAGTFRYIGVTHYQHGAFAELEQIIRKEKIDSVQLPCSVVDREAEKRLLPAAAGRLMEAELKALVAFDGGFRAEAEFSYGGPGAQERAELARDIVRRRMTEKFGCREPMRFDLIGVNSIHATGVTRATDTEDVRLRVAMRSFNRAWAELLFSEVDGLHMAGPAGGGGRRAAHHDTRRWAGPGTGPSERERRRSRSPVRSDHTA